MVGPTYTTALIRKVGPVVLPTVWNPTPPSAFETILVEYVAPTRQSLRLAQHKAGGDRITLYISLIELCVVSPKIVFTPTVESVHNQEEILNLGDRPFLLGHTMTLGQEILNRSGLFVGPLQTAFLNAAEEYLESELGRMDLMVHCMLENLTISQLEEMDPETLYKTYAIARRKAELAGVDIRMFLHPEAYAKDQKKLEEKRKAMEMQAQAEAELAARMGVSNAGHNQSRVYQQSEGGNQFDVRR